jgi:uncharacterized membrane protein
MADVDAAKGRGLAAFLVVAGIGGTAFNWYLLRTSDSYYPKFAVICPIALVMGALLLLFPRFGGKTGPGEGRKAAVQVAAVAVGAGLGFLNLWLMKRG